MATVDNPLLNKGIEADTGNHVMVDIDNNTYKDPHQDSPPQYDECEKGDGKKISDTENTTLEMMIMEDKDKAVDCGEIDSELSSTTAAMTGCMVWVEEIRANTDQTYNKHKPKINMILKIIGALLYFSYLIWAMVSDCNRARPLLALTIIVCTFIVYEFIKERHGTIINKKVLAPVLHTVDKYFHIWKWLVYFGVPIAILVFLVVEVRPHPQQLTSIAGLCVFLFLLFVFSKHPSKVKFRPVIWGLGIQFVLAIIILRTSWGYHAFKFLGEEVQRFLAYSDAGAKFIFGDGYEEHFFAFKVLPVIVFFSCTISVLYHLGAMQYVIGKIAWVMQCTMKTAPTESMVAAGNIFIGQTEAPLLVRPFIEDMTKSELHAMMTAGFATIAGAVLAAYILFQVPAIHLLCASVMNAPVALALSKLFYPETERSVKIRDMKMDTGKSRNLLEAASSGASSSIKLIANIAVNLMAFIALLAFVDATLSWIGTMVDHPELSFRLVCSYLFMPIAFLMGVEWDDCPTVASLLGTKMFINEFVAYQELSKLIQNRQQCITPSISVRSETIATYALCGFANLSSIGVQLGGIGPMAPSRRSDLASLAIRALICGTTACFVTACVAGLLTIEAPFEGCVLLNATMSNMTEPYNITTLS